MKITFDNFNFNEKTVSQSCLVPESTVKIIGDKVEITTERIEGKAPSGGYYKLCERDNLYSLSRRFNIPESVILRENGNVKLFEGVTVYIPPFSGKTYIVKPLDTFSTIAEKIGKSEEEIKRKNGVDYLFAGRVLEI